MLIPNPLHIFQEHILSATVIELSSAASRVAGNAIRADLFYDGKDWTPVTKIEPDLDDPTDTKVSILIRTAADNEFGTMSFVPQQTGWHTFWIR